MSRFRYYFLPRLLLFGSILALLAALFVLWISLERPLPTIALACRQAGPPNCFTGGHTLASGVVRMERATPDADAWAILQLGERYALFELKRTAGLLWRTNSVRLIGSAAVDSGLYAFPTAISHCYLSHPSHNLYQNEPDLSTFPEYTTELIPLAICTDPSVVRLEGELLWLASQEDPQAALASRGIPIQWSLAGSGVWVGLPVISQLPTDPENPSRSGGTMSIWCRGYDADGALVCSYDPTA